MFLRLPDLFALSVVVPFDISALARANPDAERECSTTQGGGAREGDSPEDVSNGHMDGSFEGLDPETGFWWFDD